MVNEKKTRLATRAGFTKLYNKIIKDLDQESVDLISVRAQLTILERKEGELTQCNAVIVNEMLENDATEEDLEKELEISDGYSLKVQEIVERLKVLEKDLDDKSSTANSNTTTRSIEKQGMNYRLPKLELKKFDGDLKKWLPFWGQFARIHESKDIEDSDKFQYLLQCMEDKSEPRQVVESYPATGANYSKAIDALQARYANEDMLVEVYMRELLKCILDRKNTNFSAMYDKLEGHLRSLETLGVRTGGCAAMLLPLIESALPESLLVAWQRNTNTKGTTPNERLDNLMKFVHEEVLTQKKIELAKEGLGVSTSSEGKTRKRVSVLENDNNFVNKQTDRKTDVPTAVNLLTKPFKKSYESSSNSNKNNFNKCIFCGSKHRSCDCRRSMTVSDRLRKIKENNCCYKCLLPGHKSSLCNTHVKCLNCGSNHHIIMCYQFENNKSDKANNQLEKVHGPSANEQALTTVSSISSRHSFLQTTIVSVLGNYNLKCNARVLFDSGSARSYVLKSLADRMRYSACGTENLTLTLFGGTTVNKTKHNIYKIRLQNLDETYSCNFDVLDQQIICDDVPQVQGGSWLTELTQQGIEIHDTKDSSNNIDLLIGADVMGKLLTGRKYELKNSGVVAIETLLGWTLMGKIPQPKTENNRYLSLFVRDNKIEDLWSLDVLGIKDPHTVKSKEDLAKITQQQFLDTVNRELDGRYIVRMPWLEGHLPLPTNLNVAKKRLASTLKWLNNNKLYLEYSLVLKEWEKEGIIEQIPTSEQNFEFGHFLPHRPVCKTNSTFKIRPVFDASARDGENPSLNSCLDIGPNLIELMPELMLRFRLKRIGVIADIKKAFLQISIDESERDFLKFLWQDIEGKTIIFRHRRVVFGVACSPFLLGAVIQYHIGQAIKKYEINKVPNNIYFRETLEILKNSFYVDNCISSVNDEKQLENFIENSKLIFSDAKFELRGWETTIPKYSEKDSLSSSVLGIIWNRELDVLEINMKFLDKLNLDFVTKRTILSIAHKIFDIIGVTCPIMILPKLLLQRAWEKKISWDEELGYEIKSEFVEWVDSLKYLKELRIPRWITTTGGLDNATVHVFSDSSCYAYACVIFLRSQNEDEVVVQLIEARTKILPMKQCTIPRGELLGATIAARLYDSLASELKRLKAYFWTDSTTVLAWVLREENWGVFVQNRVAEIRKLTSKEQWRHVPGVVNPADLPSRGCGAKKLVESRWWEGPDFLKDSHESSWLSSEVTFDEVEVTAELKKASRTLVAFSVETDRTWYYKKFSDYEKIIRLVAWVKRFCFNCKNPRSKVVGNLSLEEISIAENNVFLWIQSESFSDINDSKISSLNPQLDSLGIIRLKSKLIQKKDTYDFRYPIVLPHDHEVVKRMILSVHIQNCHVGLLGLLSLLREKYWILGGRRTIRKALKKCSTCRRYTVKNLNPAPAALPEPRVRGAHVFEVVGVDLAGPLYLKGHKKCWIVLFTCGVYRAVHLELLTSLSSEIFLQGLRRFIARRGRPTIIYSDNGTNFVGLENSLKNLDWDRIREFANIKRIDWRFNPPSAAWWGGWWERLIRILKDLLKRVLGKACLNYQELETILCDCEAVINNRPLTYVYESPETLTVLTPSIFLQDIPEVGVPDLDELEKGDTAKLLSNRMKYLANLRENLKTRFRSEYLGQLEIRCKKQKAQDKIKVGDIVLVGSDCQKRQNWPIAKIEELIRGHDGEVRVVKLKCSSGMIVRPIQRIFLFEAHSGDNGSISDEVVLESERSETGVVPFSETIPLKESKVKTTRSGRNVKTPQRLVESA